MFRLLNTSASGFISMQEFYCIYDVLDMKWKLRDRNQYWFTRARSQFVASAASQVHRLVTSNFFEYFICEFIISFPVIPPESMDLTGRHIFEKIAGVIIFTSGILVLVKTAALSKNLTNPLELFASWESYVFVSSTHFPALSISLIFTLNPTDFDCSLRFGSLFENIRPRYPALFRIRLEHV